jgi:uncharacterized protein
VQRRYVLADLPRLREAGALEGTQAEAAFHFLEREGWPTVAGQVSGKLVLSCQRCCEPVELTFDEPFEVACAVSEAELDKVPATLDAVLADPARVDLRLLAEEQLLLALPLVPKHSSPDCGSERSSMAPTAEGGETNQQPFANLRDLLRNS